MMTKASPVTLSGEVCCDPVRRPAFRDAMALALHMAREQRDEFGELAEAAEQPRQTALELALFLRRMIGALGLFPEGDPGAAPPMVEITGAVRADCHWRAEVYLGNMLIAVPGTAAEVSDEGARHAFGFLAVAICQLIGQSGKRAADWLYDMQLTVAGITCSGEHPQGFGS